MAETQNKKRVIITKSKDLAEYAQANGFEIYDIIENEMNNKTYYFEYSQKLELLFTTKGINYKVLKNNFSDGLVSCCLNKFIKRYINDEVIEVNEESRVNENFDCFRGMYIVNPRQQFIDNLSAKGFEPFEIIKIIFDEKSYEYVCNGYNPTIYLYKIENTKEGKGKELYDYIKTIEKYKRKTLKNKVIIYDYNYIECEYVIFTAYKD